MPSMNSNIPWRSTRNLQSLVKSPPDWYRITNRGSGPIQINIYDEIGFLGTAAQSFVNDLARIDGPVDLHINSPGGEVFDGLTIYNSLLGLNQDVTVYIDGLCASIATVIAMAGNPVKIAKSATMMIHEGHVMAAAGDAQDMRDLADALDRQSNNIAQIYALHCGGTADYWRGLMKAVTWFDAESAIEHGLADGYIETSGGRSAPVNFDLSSFRNGDKRAGALQNAANTSPVENAAHHPYVGTHDHMHEPMTGHHSHNHAAFGHTDGDDGMHAHEHYHDGDATHDHGHVSHTHSHDHDGEHGHAHDAGENSWGPHEHEHTHHTGHESHEAGMGQEDGHLNPMVGETVSYSDNSTKLYNRADALLVDKYPEARFYAKDYSQAERDEMAKSGEAMSDGSYPIKNCTDAHNARQAFGRETGSKSKLASHIRSREKALGGCGRDPFKEGASDSIGDLVITDEFIQSFQSTVRALRGA